MHVQNGIFWIQFDGPLEIPGCLSLPALLGEEEAEADVGVFVIGFDFDRATKL